MMVAMAFRMMAAFALFMLALSVQTNTYAALALMFLSGLVVGMELIAAIGRWGRRNGVR